jgi:hypothetical protein
MENWEIIEENDNYAISSFGNIKNLNSGNFLKPTINRYGYYQVNLFRNGKYKTRLMHRLVAQSFLENPYNKLEVDHIDCDRLNNNLNNLRFATREENSQNCKIVVSKNTSGVKGVSFSKKLNKWHAQITKDGVKLHLGYYKNLEDAKQIRIKKAKELFGEYKNNCEV